MKHLELTLRDFVLTALEAGGFVLATAVAASGQVTKAEIGAAIVLGVRTLAGLIANALAPPKVPSP